MEYDKNKWIYYNDRKNKVRYVLGTKGNNTILCFGANPSTATPGNLDNTLKSVERLAKNNGYDSWIMMNIYPQRATNPNDIHFEIDYSIHQKNLEFIEVILKNKIRDIWAAWGNLIEKRKFLKHCLKDIYMLTTKYNCNWLTIGKITKKGHPRHPLYLKSTSKAIIFPIKSYINKLK